MHNGFIKELRERNEHQVAYSTEQIGEHVAPLSVGAAQAPGLCDAGRQGSRRGWVAEGFTEALRTPDSTLIFVTPGEGAGDPPDQIACMGCLSPASSPTGPERRRPRTGKKADPRSFCIQKTLQEIAHRTMSTLPADVRRP